MLRVYKDILLSKDKCISQKTIAFVNIVSLFSYSAPCKHLYANIVLNNKIN